MQNLKKAVKRLFNVDHSSLNNMVHIGSKQHGYWIPDDFLNRNSICYCVGAGDDISFDTELKILYDCNIYIFDPTPASVHHFNSLKDASRRRLKMPPVGQDSSFVYRINHDQLDEINFVEKGVWTHNTTLKFYDPKIDNYVSHSVYLFKDSKEFIELPVDNLKNFMKSFGHSCIDLVKLEIEGAEYAVIENILKDKIDVKIILVEFDEVYHKRGLAHHFRIKKSSKSLIDAGYVLVHSTEKFKRTFIRKDIYEQLKKKEIFYN